MHPKDNSPTKYSKLDSTDLATSVQYVRGVGPGLGKLLAARGIFTVQDLIWQLPRRFEDRSTCTRVAELVPGVRSTVIVKVRAVSQVPTRGGKVLLKVLCGDESGSLTLLWFRWYRGMDQNFFVGRSLAATGKVEAYGGQVQISHPEISFQTAGGASSSDVPIDDPSLGRIVPVYPEIEGIAPKLLRKLVWNALEMYGRKIDECLPSSVLQKYGLPARRDAVREIHFPTVETEKLTAFRTPAQVRLVFEEFFFFELSLLLNKSTRAVPGTWSLDTQTSRMALPELKAHLPFSLTAGQEQALTEILEDLSLDHPMNRMIQGDVGSGKTIVALLVAQLVLKQGHQAAFLAPTEILVEQHAASVKRFFGETLPFAVLTGSSSKAERVAILDRIKSGEPMLLIGTHALLENPVEFTKLTFLIVDEQHRFGVDQRRALRLKAKTPHLLVMSATPIPRTLSLTLYGDLEVSTLREKPPGRASIKTFILGPKERLRAWQECRERLTRGEQVYVVAPLIEDSEAEGMTEIQSAESALREVQRELTGAQATLLHGRMSGEEKNSKLEAFRSNEIQVLVSTTVVEVGIDVPNATVMVILNAERFGLAQLHQLRGRIGRGLIQGACFLLSGYALSEATRERLAILEQSEDGFEISEHDLKLRGPGELLGTAQSGGLQFRVADLGRDLELLIRARDAALDILRTDPGLETPENAPVRRQFIRSGHLGLERLRTS